MIEDIEYIGNGKYWDISPNTEEELLRKEKSTLYGTNEYGYPTGLTLGENLQILDSQLNIVGELGAQIDDEHISTGTTYSSHKITELINQIVGFDVEIVDELPDEGDTHTIYLLSVSGETGDVYDEFLYIDGEWEQIGSTRIDLSQYYTKLETDALLNEKQDKLTPGEGVEIDTANTISVVGKQDELTAGEGIEINPSNTISVVGKQDTLIAGDNISIDTANTISAEGYKYNIEGEGVYIVGVGGYDGTNEDESKTIGSKIEEITYVTSSHINELTVKLDNKQDTLIAGEGIEIVSANTISVVGKQDTLTAGNNITIDSSNTISADVNTPVIDMTSDSGTTYAINPNIMYRFGERETLTITLIPGDANVLNEYMFEFTSGSVATTLNVPSTVTWLKDPDIQTGKVYQVSIENNLGVIAEWSNE